MGLDILCIFLLKADLKKKIINQLDFFTEYCILEQFV